MNTTVLVFCLLLLAQPPATTPNVTALRRGMSMAEVKKLLGPPPQISRQVLYRKHIEQWRYEALDTWLEFLCVRGDEPYLAQIKAGKNRP